MLVFPAGLSVCQKAQELRQTVGIGATAKSENTTPSQQLTHKYNCDNKKEVVMT